MPEPCQYCQIEPIRAANVPHNRVVWFEKVEKHYVYHCDHCGRVWSTQDVFLTQPVRVSFSFKHPAFSLKSYFARYTDHQKKAWYTILRVGPLTVTFGRDLRKWRRVRNEQAA